MQYKEIQYVPEREDPSVILQTEELVTKIIDNTGLLLPENEGWTALNRRYPTGQLCPYTHHLGYHGIRCLYNKREKRNIVVPYGSWLNLQGLALDGIENDPVDERSSYGQGRGWPMRMETRDSTVVLTIDPMPRTQVRYSLTLRPVEPDCIEFEVRFTLSEKLRDRFKRLSATWPCYINGYDDVRFFYPGEKFPKTGQWSSVGEKPDMVLGEVVNYQHQQTRYDVADQVYPVGFGRIGTRALILMFDDPKVKFYVVNAGGHSAQSSIQNPAWDFSWRLSEFPDEQPVGFTGRLIYTEFKDEASVLERYREWMAKK